MGKIGLASALAVAIAFAAVEGRAQSPPQHHKYTAQPLNLHRESLGSSALADVARARMKSGEWAGAIEAFDGAVRTSVDPSLRRDRGICHEELGDAYPAMDDFRAYLTAQPDAPDADSIRARLEKLEQETLGYSSASTDAPSDVDGTGTAKEANGATGATEAAGAPASPAPSSNAAPAAVDDAMADRDDLLRSPLRRGRGWAVAPFLSEHKWGVSPALVAFQSGTGASFGDSGTWSECVGVQVRRSLGASTAVFVEAGYEHFNSTAIDLAVVSGLTAQVGYELRFALDGNDTNQLVTALGVGYEHLSAAPSAAPIAAVAVGAFVPRVRLGYRRLLAPSAALEASLDAGVANFFRYSEFPFDPHQSESYFVGLNVAMLWGL